MGLCKKPPAFHLAACATKCHFKQTSFSLILRSKINENDVCLKFYFAAEGGGILFTQPQKVLNGHRFTSFCEAK